jgi:hypothetical protein
MNLITPDELRTIICGTPRLDFRELKQVTKYMDGYEADNQVMVWFWEVLEEFEYD